jgi:hypothetical protein
MKRVVLIVGLIGLVTITGARAADDSTNAPPPTEHRPARPMVTNLLPPRVLEALALTADQKTQYDALDTSFKKDVTDWRAKNGENGNRQELRDLRRSYLDKVRAFLTDDQKTGLQKALEAGRGPRGGQSPSTNSPATPPPPSNK